jgi:hypothetical protein
MAKRHRFENWIILSAAVALLGSAPTSAAQRTFVSAGSGSDANPCTRALPCRQFAPAITATDPGGEIVVLDSGGYGTVTIAKSVGLVAPVGVHAAVTAFSGNAITVAATTSDVVILRGLYLTGLGAAAGINFSTGKTLHVENCVVSGFASSGVVGSASGADVYVKDTISRNNGNDGFRFSAPPGSPLRASLDAIRAEENSVSGVGAYSNSIVTVTRSVAAGSGNSFYAGDTGQINVESCTAAFSTIGVYTTAGTARVANSMITGNGTGVFVGGGAIHSFGNNRLNGNTTNGTFSSPTIALQ